MGCCLWTAYELSLMPDIDLDDFRYGQLLGLAIALAFTAASYSLACFRLSYVNRALFRPRPASFWGIICLSISTFYRVDQALEAVAAASPRLESMKFKASGATIRQVFDGSEQLVAVISVPWSARQIFLPAELTRMNSAFRVCALVLQLTLQRDLRDQLFPMEGA